MEKRFALLSIEGFSNGFFTAMVEYIVKQPGLLFFDQFRHCNGGGDITQRIMSGLVSNAIGLSQVLELKTGPTWLMIWPVDSLGAQRSAEAQHVNNIPARIAIFPLPFVGVIKVSVQTVSGHLIVKADAVITHTTGTRHS